MKKSLIALSCFALVAPWAVLAVDLPAPAASDFSRLWTGWSRVNREAMSTETEEMRRVREDLASANAVRAGQLRDQGRALGERVGEIVRLGDCDEGERAARLAGDFALVEAVRAHCGRSPSAQDPAR